jgi:DNA repair protein RadA/Sms
MAKTKTIYVCANCGNTSPRWQGKCPQCGEWNTLEEQTAPSTAKGSVDARPGRPIRLSEVKDGAIVRISSGITEFDSVLGGGIVPGSLMLLGGDPGIGKSTLALQIAVHMAKAGNSVLYVSGEESAQQIKLREKRLEIRHDLPVLAETNLETVLATLTSEQPDFAVIDSIQTLNSEQVNGVVGGVSQLSYATNSLMRVAKQYHIAILLIGHVTKEGMLAGPKTIEHMVDTVLYLEGDRFGSLRLLRTSKNRFGGVGEVGVFEMREAGLAEVPNPSALFLEHREQPLAGSATTATMEGNKVLLIETQALTSTSNFGYPRRTTSGFDVNRLQLLIAILQKSLQLNLANQDVFVNVAGGFKLDERAADLPIALAIVSSYNGAPLPPDTVAFGEVGLLGEIRGVSQLEKRLKECEKLGFKNVIIGGRQQALAKKFAKLKIQHLSNIQDLPKLLQMNLL